MDIEHGQTIYPEVIVKILRLIYAGECKRKHVEEYSILFSAVFLETDEGLGSLKRGDFCRELPCKPFLPILDELVNTISDDVNEREEEVATTYEGPLTFSKARYWLRLKAVKVFIALYHCAFFIDAVQRYGIFDKAPLAHVEAAASTTAVWSILTRGDIMKRRASLFEPRMSRGYVVTKFTHTLMDFFCTEIRSLSPEVPLLE